MKMFMFIFLNILNIKVFGFFLKNNIISRQSVNFLFLQSFPEKCIPTVLNNVHSLNNLVKNIKENDIIELNNYYDKLKPNIEYLSYSEIDKVRLSLVIAYYAHYNQKRLSSEKFIIHPYNVAIILSELKCDSDTIIGGILHDTVEDTCVTLNEIERLFGENVRNIVYGVTKVTKCGNENENAYETNLVSMFLSMRNDWRIILVKLADRLHNMRTLEFMEEKKQKKISEETLEIYSPLAHRVGMWNIRNELEDLSFKNLNPMKYKEVVDNRTKIIRNYSENIDILKEKLKNILSKIVPGKYDLEYRTKSIYSAWKKAERNNCEISDLKDLIAIRVIINEDWVFNLAEPSSICFIILSKIHKEWKYVPGTVKDYINFPKQNGYQSLHTTILTENNLPLEIQIRTKKMHNIAENGTAAHWKYKSDKLNKKSVSWLNILDERDKFVSKKSLIKSALKLPTTK